MGTYIRRAISLGFRVSTRSPAFLYPSRLLIHLKVRAPKLPKVSELLHWLDVCPLLAIWYCLIATTYIWNDSILNLRQRPYV